MHIGELCTSQTISCTRDDTVQGAALLMLGKVDEAIASIQEAIRIDPGNGQAHQTLARALWVGKGDFSAAIPVFERSIVLNPDAGYSYLQLGLLLSWERRFAEAERVLRRAVELQDQFISGNAGLQMVGANARLGYVYYLQGRYDDAIREYDRGVSFLQTSDHALKERSLIELEVKLGAAYHRAGRMESAKKHFDKAVKTFEARASPSAPTIRSRGTTSPTSTRCAAIPIAPSTRSSASTPSSPHSRPRASSATPTSRR